MIIKIDCREKDLLELMTPPAPTPAPVPAPAPVPVLDHYMMDLGDGITIKVPLPKTTMNTKMKTPRKSLGTMAAAATNHEIKSERLPLGDIILHDPKQGRQGRDIVIFERKTLNDLAASIQDGRYKEQSFRLIETAAATGFHPHNIVYIIEGDLAQYETNRNRNNRITKTALQSAMVSLMYYKGFSVIRTMSLGETAEFILHFADKVTKEGGDGATPAYDGHGDDTVSAVTTQAYSEVSTKKEKRDYITRENIGEIMLAQVPGVSAKVATAILTKYGGSLYEFLVDLHRKINNYEESLSPEMSPPSPQQILPHVPILESIEPMNKNKLKHVSECFKDVTIDGKRGIGKVTVEKLCFFLGR
jgi:ERCC4-type nuclease